jgi:hypothetical protein
MTSNNDKEQTMTTTPELGDLLVVWVEPTGHFDGLTPEYELTPDHPGMDPVEVVTELSGLAAEIIEAFGVDIVSDVCDEGGRYYYQCEVGRV